MKFQSAKKFNPKTPAGDAKALPLAERIMLWHDRAGKMADRFRIGTRRLPFASKIFLLRQYSVSINRRINYWELNWRPILQLWRQASFLQKVSGDNLHSVDRPMNEAGRRNGRSYLSPRHDSQEIYHPRLNVIDVSRSERLFILIPRSLSGMAFPSHELTKLGHIIRRQNNDHFERLDIAKRQFVESRQRVESQTVDRGGLMSVRHVLLQNDVLRKMDSNEPATPVFHKNKPSHEVERPDIHKIQFPMTPSIAPFGMTPPQMDLNQITDQVIRQLDRRLVIWRERTGRV